MTFQAVSLILLALICHVGKVTDFINKDHYGLSVFLQSDCLTLLATPAQVSRREGRGISTHLPLLVSVIHLCCLPPAIGISIKVNILCYHRFGSPESVPIIRPLRCTGSGSQHREAAVLFDGERLPIREISWQLHFNATVLQIYAEDRDFHSICTSMFDSQTPFQASLPNMQSGSRGCSFPKLPGPDGHPLL
ncbi:hypothetical protein H0G86_008387 [Trichoderma simmonsii]|uniref:Uncharacterized protein n=1 Tax=Trichoderma simmonsii TaxID=1491479 RepID=A0A8G0PI22_9HYPO|nr:hypothetical protein H0G86_008387 [Trichoderma simmonsii]